MRVDIPPEERLERVARLLVKAMYLSLDDHKAECDGDDRGYTADSGRIADAEEYGERGYAVGRTVGGRRYGTV